MVDQEGIINLRKKLFDDNNQERIIVWANLSQISNCVSVPTFCLLADYLWLLLENSFFKKLVTNQLFQWDICVVQLAAFYHHQD